MFRIMVGLHKHPKTGVYYFRKGIPKNLRPALGGRHEFLVSLGTKDPAEARRKLPVVAADAEAKLARARDGVAHLTHEQIVALVGVWYRRELEQWTAEPGNEATWEATLESLRFHDESDHRAKAVATDVEDLLSTQFLKVSDETRAAIAEQLFPYKVRLAQTALRRTRGDYRPDDNLAKFPEWKTPGETKDAVSPTLTGIITGWAAERKPPERTKYQWERIFKSLEKYLGHEDALRISREDVLGWKDGMIADGLSATTVKNKLTVASTLFGWARENKRISENPAERIRLYAKRERAKKRLPYTTDEAKLVLTKSRGERKPERRWVPWLLAFSGARLGEVCDATAQDIRKIGDVWCLGSRPIAFLRFRIPKFWNG